MALPELDIEVGCGALGGRFTTVEGLLTAIKNQIQEQSRFFLGDSAESSVKQRIEEILNQIDEIVALKRRCTLVLDDPAGNSYIQVSNASFSMVSVVSYKVADKSMRTRLIRG